MPFVTLLVPFFPTLRLVFTVQASQASAAVQQKRTSLGPFRNKNNKTNWLEWSIKLGSCQKTVTLDNQG